MLYQLSMFTISLRTRNFLITISPLPRGIMLIRKESKMLLYYILQACGLGSEAFRILPRLPGRFQRWLGLAPVRTGGC